MINVLEENCSESAHCPEVKDQWDCVLNDLEELGDKEFLVLMDQYNTDIFFSSSSCHAALPRFIRPMLRSLKIVLKIIFSSPEFNRSIFFSK